MLVQAVEGGHLLEVNLPEFVASTYKTLICFDLLVQDKTKTTLMMEDLSAALAEYGINARKPDFYL